MYIAQFPLVCLDHFANRNIPSFEGALPRNWFRWSTRKKKKKRSEKIRKQQVEEEESMAVWKEAENQYEITLARASAKLQVIKRADKQMKQREARGAASPSKGRRKRRRQRGWGGGGWTKGGKEAPRSVRRKTNTRLNEGERENEKGGTMASDGRHFGGWNIYFFLVHFVRKCGVQNYNVNHPFYFVRFAKNFEFLERVLKDFRVKSRKFN